MIFVFFWDGIFSGIRCLSLILVRHAVNPKRLGEVEQQRAKRTHMQKRKKDERAQR